MPRPARIRRVDDERLIALDLQWRLTHLSYAFGALATTESKTIQQALVHRPDRMLMDIHVQGPMDDPEAAAVIPYPP